MENNKNTYEISLSGLIIITYKNIIPLIIFIFISLTATYLIYSNIEKIYSGKNKIFIFTDPGHHYFNILYEDYKEKITNKIEDKIVNPELIPNEKLKKTYIQYNLVDRSLSPELIDVEIKKINSSNIKMLDIDIEESIISFNHHDKEFIKEYLHLIMSSLNKSLINDLEIRNSQLLALSEKEYERVESQNQKKNDVTEKLRESIVNVDIDDLDRLFYGSALSVLSTQSSPDKEQKDALGYEFIILKHIALQEYLNYVSNEEINLINYDINYTYYSQFYPNLSLILVLQFVLVLSIFLGILVILFLDILRNKNS
tara:strand:- start:7956 stop:8894 length:939 start_codon:yes stop_codon:yes gene_type:complete